ncbi:MAG: FUSC family protein, partial [Candidatus Nanopelagicales bacterium]
MRWPFEDPGHVALRRAVRTTLGTASAVAAALWLLPGSPGIVLAAFGVFALLAFADFGGTLGRRFVALISTGIAGVILITVGTLAAGVVWRVVVVTFLVTGTLAYIVVLRGAFANAAPALTVVFVVTVMVATSTDQLPAMLQGYAVAVVIAIPITLFVFPRRTPAHVRAACVLAMRTLAEHERNRLAGHPHDLLALDGALHALRSSYLGNPFRSTGLRRADRALLSLVGNLQALLTATRRTAETPTPVSDLPGNTESIHKTIACLDSIADGLQGDAITEPTGAALAQAWAAEWDVAVQCLQDSTPESLEGDLRQIAHAFPDRALGISAVRLSILVRRFLGLPAETFDTGTHTVPEPPDYQPWAALRTQFTTKSPWMRTALRTGVAMAIAAGVVEILGLAHGFWVLLGVIATLRQDSLGTLRTALLAVGGTFGGALVGAGLLLLFTGDEPGMVVAFLITAFLSVYFQGTAPFALAQGVFSLYVVLVFSIVAWPPDLSTATDRVLDIAIGAGISLATAFLLWPRGVVAG